MQYFLAILIVLFLIWPVIKKPVRRWFNTFMAHRAEDMMRRMMGMPSRKEERRRKRREQRREYQSRGKRRSSGSEANSRGRTASMMRQVAVDVEYTEIKEFDSRTEIESDGSQTRIIEEQQITDAEYTEIKT